MFAESQGYVLQPLALRQKTSENTSRYRLRVRLISAQRLPPSSDITVTVSVTIPSESDDAKTRQTNPIKGPTLNPHWNEAFAFDLCSTTSMLDLSFLHIKIHASQNHRDGLLAQWIRPLGRTRRGYHHLPLYDGLFSKYVFATLFVRIDLDRLEGV